MSHSPSENLIKHQDQNATAWTTPLAVALSPNTVDIHELSWWIIVLLNDSCPHWISLVDLPIFPADCWRSPWFSALTPQPFRQDSKMSWNTSSSPAVRLYTGYNWRTSMERPTNWRPSGRAGSAHVPKIWSRSFSMNFVAGNDHNQPWSICDFDTGLPQEESWPLGR